MINKNTNKSIETNDKIEMEDNLKLLIDFSNDHFNELVQFNDQIFRLIGWAEDSMDYYVVLKSLAPMIKPIVKLFDYTTYKKVQVKSPQPMGNLSGLLKKRKESQLLYLSWVGEPEIIKDKMDSKLYNKLNEFMMKYGCPKENKIFIDRTKNEDFFD